MLPRILCLFAFLTVTGCPEPPRSPPGGVAPEGGGTVGSPPGGGAPASGGQTDEPATQAPPAGWTVDATTGVRLSGTVAYAGSKQGTLRIDFLKASSGSNMPTLEHTLKLPAPGPWEVFAPKDLGSIDIFAYIDLDENGPSPGEPKVVTDPPVQVAAEPVDGVTLTIRDDWDETDGQKRPPPDAKGKGSPPASP
ncbi:MAG: hypothetical protein JXB39_14595 [Deltaproteobacteria bacterium]|nr:hypothetical protein [Deltaproteobacteria bacterium]